MRFQYSTRPPSQSSLPAVYSAVPRPHDGRMRVAPETLPTDGCHDLKSPADTAPKPPLFIRCFARSLLVRKDTPTPQQLRKLASAPRNPQVRSIGGK